MNWRSTARDWTPPALLRTVRSVRGRGLRFGGQPRGWADALAASTGYDAPLIVERVAAATRAVLSGQARFERDSVLFDQADYPFATVAMLLRAALHRAGTLHVLDIGGSLGSTYRHCKPMLDEVHTLRWCVVEQPHFVAAGRAEFETNELSFAASVVEATSVRTPHVALLASVMQYLENPEVVLQALADSGATNLVIDRTPLTDQRDDILCIQHVPESIYPASYPCRLFSRDKLLASLTPNWRVVADFPCAEGAWRTEAGVAFSFRGLALERLKS